MGNSCCIVLVCPLKLLQFLRHLKRIFRTGLLWPRHYVCRTLFLSIPFIYSHSTYFHSWGIQQMKISLL